MIHRTRGFTLLEVLLALGLSVLVIAGVATAIYVHLRAVDAGRADVEEAQLARALLSRMADDLRGAVPYCPIDTSNVSLKVSSSSGSGSSGASGSGSADGSSGSGSGGSGSGGAGSGASGSGSQSSGDGSNSSGSSGDSSGSSSNTSGLAASVVPPAIPGLYGNSGELMVDVSRLPRLDQLETMISGSNAPLSDLPSDVKTVTYYVNNTGGVPNPSGPADSQGGLVRREMDRAATAFAVNNGGADDLGSDTPPLAPEVTAVQFQYYDGSQWLDEWDTVDQGSLPVAVSITIVLAPRTRSGAAASSPGAQAAANGDLQSADPAHVYSTMVYLVASKAGKTATASSSSSSSDSGTGDSSSGASGGSSSTAASSAGGGTAASGAATAGGGTTAAKNVGSIGSGAAIGSGASSGGANDVTKKGAGR